MSADTLRVDVHECSSTRILVLAGELDAYTCEQLRNLGESSVAGTHKMVVNVDKLDYIDSAGLAALVHIWVLARDQNVELVLSSRNRRVNRILEITGLDRLFGSDPIFGADIMGISQGHVPSVAPAAGA